MPENCQNIVHTKKNNQVNKIIIPLLFLCMSTKSVTLSFIVAFSYYSDFLDFFHRLLHVIYLLSFLLFLQSIFALLLLQTN